MAGGASRHLPIAIDLVHKRLQQNRKWRRLRAAAVIEEEWDQKATVDVMTPLLLIATRFRVAVPPEVAA